MYSSLDLKKGYLALKSSTEYSTTVHVVFSADTIIHLWLPVSRGTASRSPSEGETSFEEGPFSLPYGCPKDKDIKKTRK